MFAVALSILVISFDPLLRLGAELMTRIENAIANTASRIRNSTYKLDARLDSLAFPVIGD